MRTHHRHIQSCLVEICGTNLYFCCKATSFYTKVPLSCYISPCAKQTCSSLLIRPFILFSSTPPDLKRITFPSQISLPLDFWVKVVWVLLSHQQGTCLSTLTFIQVPDPGYFGSQQNSSILHKPHSGLSFHTQEGEEKN